jgi:hypothetical protein
MEIDQGPIPAGLHSLCRLDFAMCSIEMVAKSSPADFVQAHRTEADVFLCRPPEGYAVLVSVPNELAGKTFVVALPCSPAMAHLSVIAYSRLAGRVREGSFLLAVSA